jgi:molecular chaperone GrpE
LKEGLYSIYDLLISLFHSIGVEPIPVEGKFDPHLHVAIATVEDRDKPDGTVVEEKLRGFFYKGKVLRFAEVVIVKNPQQGRE